MAIAESVRQRDQQQGTDTDLYYMGPEAFNADELHAYRINYVYCTAGKQRRYRSVRNYLDVFKVIGGIFMAFWKLFFIYPDVVMSKGGYTSVPIVIAAWLLRIPIVIHESDAVPGRANKLAANLARYIGIAHDDVSDHFPAEKVALVGMPIRQFFFNQVPNPHEQVGIPTDRPVLLVTTGSLGAERINNLILQALPKLLTTYTVLHQTGDPHATEVAETAASLLQNDDLLSHYFVTGHFSQRDMMAAMQAATLVISRAGSTTLFELALLGKPAIIIPIPEDVSRDQRTNAYAYAHSGAASVIEEHNLNDDILAAEITRILSEPGVYEQMSTAARNFTVGTAADTLASILFEIGKEHE